MGHGGDMHPAVKALIAWCVAGYAAALAENVLRFAIVGALGHVFVFPIGLSMLVRVVMRIPFATGYCLVIFVLAVLTRMGLRRLWPNSNANVGLSFVIATLLASSRFIVGVGWHQMNEGMISPADLLFQAVTLSLPYGLAALGVYWTVYRARPGLDMAKVF